MAKSPTKLPILCAIRRVRIRSPHLQPKLSSKLIKSDQKMVFPGNGWCKNLSAAAGAGETKSEHGSSVGNRIMVVVDASHEANGALQWALSHSVQSQDTIFLLYVTKQFKGDEYNKMELNLRAYQLLHSMRNMCQMRRPGVNVEVALLEGKENGPIIVEEAKRQRVSLLILGQRKRPVLWRRLLRMWVGNSKRHGAVEYCIQNANCMTIAVRRKSNKLGGYLITTKRHKNFWLLA